MNTPLQFDTEQIKKKKRSFHTRAIMAFSVFCWFLLAAVLLADAGKAVQLSFGGTNHQTVVYACANGSIQLPWKALTSERESILDIQWYFHGQSEEMIAMYSHGHFVALPSFSDGRVEFLANAGLVIHYVTELDKGNYSVEVTGLNANGSAVTLRDTVTVRITDGLPTTEKELHATQLSIAEYNATTKQFHIVLTCGNFVYSPEQPFDLKWQTPSGSEVPSTSYTDGQFRLQLPNPVPGGSYACRVPASAAASACVPGNGQHEVNVSVQVDRVEARLTLLEADNGQLVQQLTQVNTQYSQQLTQLVQLERHNTALENQLENFINDSDTHQVSFHAKIIYDFVGHDNPEPIVFGKVQLNHGGAYNASTGKFTAPVSGIYFFAVTTLSGTNGVAAEMVSGDIEKALCEISTHTQYEMGTCQAVVRVAVGQSVWMVNHGSELEGPISSFSGFLITAE